MAIQAITTKVISTLGNKESLIPIMIKDGVDSLSLTCKSFKEGGTVEGIDRATDEFGTQAIWIGGIPFFKKLIDVTAYKAAKINPAVDPRILADKEYSFWALKNAKGIMSNSKTETVKTALSDCLKDGGKKAKNLYKGKVAVATALTLGAFFFLTKTKQKNTKNNVKKEMNDNVILKNNIKETDLTMDKNTPKIFGEINKCHFEKQPAFKGLGKNVVDAVMFNPVHNMKIIDAGITTERLACSRNKVEFCEHAIKEGGFLFFIYGFGNLIEKGINKFSSNVLKKPIDLAIDVIMDNDLSKALSNNTILKDLSKAPLKDKSLTKKLDFIVNNPDNILVKAAKKSNIVSTVKDKSGNIFVDTSKYIDMKQFEQLADNLKNLDKNFKLSNEPVKKFTNKLKGLKVSSVAANVGISCLFLGVLIPKLIYKFRNEKTGSTKFHVAEDIKNNSKSVSSK